MICSEENRKDELEVLFGAVLSGDATPEENAALERHLGSCAACRLEFERLRGFRGALRNAYGLEGTVVPMPVASSDLKPRPESARKRSIAPFGSAAGLLLAASLVLAVYLAGPTEPVTDPIRQVTPAVTTTIVEPGEVNETGEMELNAEDFAMALDPGHSGVAAEFGDAGMGFAVEEMADGMTDEELRLVLAAFDEGE